MQIKSVCLTSLFLLGAITGGRAHAQTAPAVPLVGNTPPVQSTPPPPIPPSIANYRIHPGDVVEIAVFQKPELTKTYPIPPDGKIVYPFLGSLKIAAMTTSEISSLVAERLAKEITNPQVSVNIVQRQTFEVSVLGAVRSPGKRTLGDGWRLLNLIADSGGLAVAKPEWATATLVRNGAQTVPVNLTRLMESGDAAENIALEPGDLLLITEVDAARFALQVMGEVGKPGNVVVPKDGSLLSVINAVGGFTPRAALGQVALTRDGKTTYLDLRDFMNSGKVLAAPALPPTQAITVATSTPSVPKKIEQAEIALKLQPGDVLLVPQNKLVFAVMGAVGHSGPIEYPETGSLTVLRALTLAGGASSGAELRQASLVHPLPDSTGQVDVQPINLEELLKKRDAKSQTRDIAMQPGDMLFIPEKTLGRQRMTLRDAMGYLPFLGMFVR